MVTVKTNNGAIRKRMISYKSRWTRKEDHLLTTLINRHGPGKWDFLAKHIKGRTGKSCRLRWINQLNPRVDKSPFSEEEQRRLLQLHLKYGNKWSLIVSHFPGRTDNHVKNMYHSLVGSRYMKKNSSSKNPNPQRKRGAMPSSCYGRISTAPVGSKFSSVSGQGNYSGFVPYSTVLPKGIIRGNSVMSDANSAAPSKFSPVPQPQQEVGIKNYQFIDFLGVGSSECKAAA